jgi:geranylgeranyl diphosphate synthase type II
MSSDAVEASLEAYRTVAVRQLLARVPDREPRRYLYDLIPSYPTRPGKGLRPGLCMASCRAFGGSTQAVIDSAVAIELFHNAFLVHDDLGTGASCGGVVRRCIANTACPSPSTSATP